MAKIKCAGCNGKFDPSKQSDVDNHASCGLGRKARPKKSLR